MPVRRLKYSGFGWALVWRPVVVVVVAGGL